MNTSSSMPVISSMPVTSGMPVTTSNMPVISSMPVTTSNMPVTTSSMPVTTSNMPVITSSMQREKYNKDEDIEVNENKSAGLMISLIFNSILIIVIFFAYIIEFLKMNKFSLFWFLIAFLTLIGIGLAEILTYNNYKNLGTKEKSRVNINNFIIKRESYDKVIKIFSYINFAIAGFIIILLIFNLIIVKPKTTA